MVETRFGGAFKPSPQFDVTLSGSQPGPPGGDGWEVVTTLPQARLPNKSSVRLAIMVTGRMGHLALNGATPVDGRLQLCLGQVSGGTGIKSTVHFQELNIARERQSCPAPESQGIQFSFLMVQQALEPGVALEIVDPTFGPTFNNTTGNEWCLWARMYWGNDAPAYTCQWRVMEVDWVWFDMDELQARGDAVAEVSYSSNPQGDGVPNGAAWNWIQQGTLSVGSVGEDWLHMAAVSMQSRVDGLNPGTQQGVTQWQFGHATAGPSHSGMVAKVGAGDGPIELSYTGGILEPWWGQNRVADFRAVIQSQGALWTSQKPAGDFALSIRARGWPSLLKGRFASLTFWRRVIILSVNITKVEGTRDDASVYEGDISTPNSSPLYGPPDYEAWKLTFEPLARIAQDVIKDPVVFAHSMVAGYANQRQIAAHGLRDDLELGYRAPTLPIHTDENEGMSLITVQGIVFPAEQPNTQLQLTTAHLVPAEPWGPAFLPTGSIHLACVDLVYEREGSTPEPPWVEPEATWLQLGSEGAQEPSQSTLVEAPDAVLDVGVVPPEFGRIDGAHYSRSWPLFAKPRRQWQLTWSHPDKVKSVIAFLEANPVFAWSVPGQSAGNRTVVAQDGPYEVEYAAENTAQLRVAITELIFTT